MPMRSIPACVFALVALAACQTGHPYNLKPPAPDLSYLDPNTRGYVEINEDGEQLMFVYGKFCGGGWPRLVAPLDQPHRRTRTLVAMWPPVDDIDATCYAHDYCLEKEGNDNTVCDVAMRDAVFFLERNIDVEGCGMLASDMSTAFFAKPWSHGKTDSETFASRTVSTLFSAPLSAVWFLIQMPVRPFLKWPKTGTCNVGDSMDAKAAIERFERFFATTPLNFEKSVFRVGYLENPIPADMDVAKDPPMAQSKPAAAP